MRRVIYFVAMSLDGYLARPDGGIDWLLHDQDYGFSEFFGSIDTVLLGRKTYDLARSFEEYPYSTKENYIFSRSLGACAHGTVVEEPIAQFVGHLLAMPGQDIWLVGGGELAGAFFAEQAVDDLIVFVHPILIGSGRSLAASLPEDVRLRLTGSEEFSSGLVKLAYSVQYN